MNRLRAGVLLLVSIASLTAGDGTLRAQSASPSSGSSASQPERADSADWADRRDGTRDQDRAADEDRSDADDFGRERGRRHRHHGHDVVNIGRNSDLPAGERADSVVSIAGSSSAAGDAGDVVSVLGNTTVTGTVRNSAVAVLGNTVIDGAVDGDVVSVLGSVDLGPNANVRGDVVAVGGTVQRDPAAQVHGAIQSVVGGFAGFGWLKPWVEHCLFYGRPLALAPGLGWAWGLALGFLALYAGLAWLFPEGITRCVHTLESQPGMTLVAALITVLATPVLLILLCITVVGIAAVPFVAAGLFCAGLFGKAVMLSWLGHRAVGSRVVAGGFTHPALAVLAGGAIVLVLYLVPVLGFLVYKALGLFGLGAVVYTLVMLVQARRAERPSTRTPTSGAGQNAGAIGGAGAAADLGAGSGLGASSDPAATASAAAASRAGGTPGATIIAAGLPRAGFWIRMAALLLDAVLVGFFMAVVQHGSHVHLLVLAIYGAVMWKLRGSTVGGIVFDLQVVRLDDRPIDWETAIVRALACFLSLAVAGLGFIWIAFDGGRQAWHDKIAGTVVVRVRKAVPLV